MRAFAPGSRAAEGPKLARIARLLLNPFQTKMNLRVWGEGGRVAGSQWPPCLQLSTLGTTSCSSQTVRRRRRPSLRTPGHHHRAPSR